MPLTVVQLLPELEVGGVERGTIEIAAALSAAGHRAVVVSGGGRLVAELEATGAEHVRLPIGVKRPWTLRHVRTLRRLFDDVAADVVHARSRLPAWLGRLALRGLATDRRPAWITTVHGPYTVNGYSRVMASGERVIAISDFIRDYVLTAYPRTDPAIVRTIPRGVDRKRFPFGLRPDADWLADWQRRFPPEADGGPAMLLCAGRLTRWKGQEHFLQVVAGLRDAGERVHGLVLGAAHPRRRQFADTLERLVTELGLEQHVSFLGGRDDVANVMAVSRCAFSLTLEPEAFGRTTIEALSVGCPVVGYDHGGTAEILRELEPAGLVRVGDVDHAVAVTREILRQPPALPRDHRFTRERMCADTLAVYAELAPAAGQA